MKMGESKLLEIKPSPGRGRGVFACSYIPVGACIERSPVVEIPQDEIIHIRRTVIQNYYFKWGRDRKDAAIALGFGSLFNHSYQPNARFVPNVDEQVIEFYAIKPIQPGEEITINYNGDPQDRSRLWFQPLESNVETA